MECLYVYTKQQYTIFVMRNGELSVKSNMSLVRMQHLISPGLFFSDVEGVLKSANDTEYGLASGVFTKDLSKVSL